MKLSTGSHDIPVTSTATTKWTETNHWRRSIDKSGDLNILVSPASLYPFHLSPLVGLRGREMHPDSIGIGDGRQGGICPPKFGKTYFSGNVKFGHFLKFSYVYFRAKISCTQSWLSSYMYTWFFSTALHHLVKIRGQPPSPRYTPPWRKQLPMFASFINTNGLQQARHTLIHYW